MESKNHKKLIQRHIWEAYIKEAEHLRHHVEVKKIYVKREETIERIFAEAYFCCHEFEKACHLDMASCLIGDESVS